MKCIFSIVSHGHGSFLGSDHISLLLALIKRLEAPCILTINAPELEPEFFLSSLQKVHDWGVEVIVNSNRKGFGANHNSAFELARQRYGEWLSSDAFCVLNPDVFWQVNPLHSLDTYLLNPSTGLVYPIQTDSSGRIQDHARELVTPMSVFQRQVLGKRVTCDSPTWVNGAFMLFRAGVYRQLGGFDERYFMYGEDVDICLRLQLAGYKMTQADVIVIHDTQRRTLRDPRHFSWHIRSLLRLWTSKPFWQYWWRLHYAPSKLP